MTHDVQRMRWFYCPRADGRDEYVCEHGIGHGNHVHGCDGCCRRSDFPLGQKLREVKRR